MFCINLWIRDEIRVIMIWIWRMAIISEHSRKSYIVDLANDVHCNFPPEASMNNVSSYEITYWLERIFYNFLICSLKREKRVLTRTHTTHSTWAIYESSWKGVPIPNFVLHLQDSLAVEEFTDIHRQDLSRGIKILISTLLILYAELTIHGDYIFVSY